jgi:anti-sigma regulatory factor (Ser/Thr protein kinase)
VAERPEAARIALPRSPSSVGTARRFIAARTAAWAFPEPAADQLVLIGSELVTNAVLHARTELTLTLEVRDDRVRISVKDRSQTPATLRHYRLDALTGRGLGVVAALSDRWGVSTTPDGKVVWAELQANGEPHAPTAPTPADPPAAPSAPPADAPGTRPVRYPGVPVDGYLELQAHNDALFRELELISIELEGDNAAQVAAPLADLVDQLYRRFRGQRDSYREVVAAAQAAGRSTVELETAVSPAAVAGARGYLALLEQADELCRAGVLLTPEPTSSVKALRGWFVDQMAAQVLHGATPAAPGQHPAMASDKVNKQAASDLLGQLDDVSG